jgi:hypothetical protein
MLSALAVEPTRSQKRTLTTLRSSRRLGWSVANGLPHELQKRDPCGFSSPHPGQVSTAQS